MLKHELHSRINFGALISEASRQCSVENDVKELKVLIDDTGKKEVDYKVVWIVKIWSTMLVVVLGLDVVELENQQGLENYDHKEKSQSTG